MRFTPSGFSRKTLVISTAALAATALLLTGCAGGSGTASSTDGGSAGGGGDSSITVIPKSLGNKYFEASDKGAAAAADELGMTFKEVGPTATGSADQVPFIQTAIQTGQKAIAIAANDPTAVCNDLSQAQSQGVKVVAYDTDTDCRDVFVNQATVDGVAEGLVKLTADHLGDEGGTIAILSGGANAANLNAWVDAIQALIKKDHPKITVAKVAYGDDVDEKAYQEAQGLMQSIPDLKAIIAPDTVSVKEAAHYLSDTPEYQGKVWVTGLGLPSEMKDYVDSGIVEQFGLWNPEDLGYLASYAADALIKGDITGKEGDTFTAGKLGDYTVGADGEIVLGPLFVFNKDNVGDFSF
ncbi:rhamnose ABC transporter substrate-binding protein [Herbiconiux sp. CPCC 205716]|uniref:Rhamnose ABC transporter substrate-binding protein n=1 Tax=Herbiconiux gentiana TaxID=2970912 RepID=A0ABT2GIL0_9MICO|nr:rhamnose ABC transporter substrate-binding protein [Herbiconiux gentiana]MCS5716069.1 rhamnose ABC transporter substrate-binding protein [Herbiconiux gentiana]